MQKAFSVNILKPVNYLNSNLQNGANGEFSIFLLEKILKGVA